MAEASSPAYNITGAIHHFIRTPGVAGIWYLGTCEVAPQVSIQQMSKPVMNDTHGRMLPAQKTDQGEMAQIGLVLNRYSEITRQYMENPRLDSDLAVATGLLQLYPGRQGRFGRGSLVFGSKTFELWQVFERQMVAGTRDSNMPYGYYWPQCELLKLDYARWGNDDKCIMAVIEAQALWTGQASNTSVADGERGHTLYSTRTADFPDGVLVPQ